MKTFDRVIVIVLILIFVGLIGAGIYTYMQPAPEYSQATVWYGDGAISGDLISYEDYGLTVELNIEGVIVRTSWDNVVVIK